MNFDTTDSTLLMLRAYEKCISNLSYVKESPHSSSIELYETEHIILRLLSELHRFPDTDTASNLSLIYTWMLHEITIMKTHPNEKKIAHIILVVESLIQPLVTFFEKSATISSIHMIEMQIDETLRSNNKTLFLELTTTLNEMYQSIQ